MFASSEEAGGAARPRPLPRADTPEPRERFATNLREARLRSGLSQEHLAASCDLHRTEISLLERRQRDPRLSTIVRLARCLGVTPADLLTGIE